MDISAEYEWVYNQNLNKFRGKWIAVYNKKIISSGKYADHVVRSAKQRIDSIPFLIKIPLERYISI